MTGIKRAKEWLSHLPIEDMRVVNTRYNEYAQQTSVIFRMGKDEWLLNEYYENIKSWTLSSKKSGEEMQDDGIDTQSKAEDKESEDKVEEKETREEDITNPIDESQNKLKMMKLALVLLTAGSIWMLI